MPLPFLVSWHKLMHSLELSNKQACRFIKERKMNTSLTFRILVLFFSISHTIGVHNSKTSVNVVSTSTKTTTTVQTSKHYHENFCYPFFMYPCSHQYPNPPQPPSTKPLLQSPPSPPPPPPQPSSTQTQLSFIDQRLAVVYPVIQKFKSTINSDPFGITKTWVGSDVCGYRGFYCDHPPDNISAITVASVDFNGYQLGAPTLDGFLDQLQDIALFHANTNSFSGTISPNIAKLQYLYELDISNNQFSGVFPMAVLGMDGLNFLDIRFNMFSGSVPPAIYTQNLNVLFLNDNSFVSTLPDNLQNTHILYLTLANNKFMGPIPSDISIALSALTEVLLLDNQLTGCLPYELGLLNRVTIFDVSNNLLTGQLPFSLSCLENVEVLNFATNLLYGMVPDLICGLPNLANLSLADNYFIQVGPRCRRLISKGILDIRNNCIPGFPFQRSVMECAQFFSVPRLCPHMETFMIIPCKPFHFP